MKVNITIGIPAWLDKIFTWPVMVYRKHKYGWPFRKIYLGENEWTIVDPDIYYRLGHFKWFLIGSKKKFYAVRHVKTGPFQTKMVRLHRENMNAPAGLLVDHRNSNPLDNRRDNLREATPSQNMQNRRIRKKHTASSQFIGVYFDKGRKNWIYQLRANGKLVSSGRFATEVEAARTRDRAALKYHGEFARLNFPREDYIPANGRGPAEGDVSPTGGLAYSLDEINALKQNAEKSKK